jgi:hypothetical protein
MDVYGLNSQRSSRGIGSYFLKVYRGCVWLMGDGPDDFMVDFFKASWYVVGKEERC